MPETRANVLRHEAGVRREPDGGTVEAGASSSVARALLDAGCVTLRLDEPVTFRSGLRAPVYVDNRRLLSRPASWRIVIEALLARLRASAIAPDLVAGVETAGIPHSSALAYAAGMPAVFVRKELKGHGLGRRVEGGDVEGRRVLLVEDMVTTGGSSLSAVRALREAGAVVDACLAIVSYGLLDALRAFADAEVALEVLTPFETVVAAAEAMGVMTALQATTLRRWLADPADWAPV